ncbi:MAG TPA: metallophosphoesterase [Acidobacteriaceae bacterium]|nr:metallophosphoesterase [Acidobacteriaceae bacterium]
MHRRRRIRLHARLALTVCAALLVTPLQGLQRESGQPSSASHTVPALMISDIHFDPFHDPGKARSLADEPASAWAAVLSRPDSPDEAEAFARMQKTCHARGVDTPYLLLQSAVAAMRASELHPSFVTITGDLIAHDFSCRYATAGLDAKNYESFVEKTIEFVAGQLRAAYPGVPVYISTGNNDSACGDYRFDPGSSFEQAFMRLVRDSLPPAVRATFRAEDGNDGSYSVMMAAPVAHTRLIVLNDVYDSPKYRTCGGAADPAPAAAQLAWLSRELQQAQTRNERVWVMGHIPPGVNAYATLSKIDDVCGRGDVDMFLTSDQLVDLLAQYAPELRLVLFAHTHMDEFRLLRLNDASTAPAHAVAVKLVPSISPVNGNNPAFTLAYIDPATAVLENYAVIAASNQTGIGTTWTQEYDYADVYHEPDFSPASLENLMTEFRSDPHAQSAASREYIRDYYVGDRSRELSPFWPEYVCSLDHLTAKGFAACVCQTAK